MKYVSRKVIFVICAFQLYFYDPEKSLYRQVTGEIFNYSWSELCFFPQKLLNKYRNLVESYYKLKAIVKKELSYFSFYYKQPRILSKYISVEQSADCTFHLQYTIQKITCSLKNCLYISPWPQQRTWQYCYNFNGYGVKINISITSSNFIMKLGYIHTSLYKKC